MRRPNPDPVGPGQESVWAYPRPPALAPSDEHVVVRYGGQTIAERRRAIRVLETSHAPVYYLPPDDVRLSVLEPIARRSVCEFKGVASDADVVVGDHRAPAACWWYEAPTRGYAAIADWIAFFPSKMDLVTVDGEAVRPVGGDADGRGCTRRIGAGSGGVRERITATEWPQRLEYRVVNPSWTTYPVDHHLGTGAFVPLADGGTEVRWEVAFAPKRGAGPFVTAATRFVIGRYLDALARACR